jgi:hypothetical protein
LVFGKTVGDITELYSDRQLCCVCEGKARAVPRAGGGVKWVVVCRYPDHELAAMMNSQSAERLKEMIQANL